MHSIATLHYESGPQQCLRTRFHPGNIDGGVVVDVSEDVDFSEGIWHFRTVCGRKYDLNMQYTRVPGCLVREGDSLRYVSLPSNTPMHILNVTYHSFVHIEYDSRIYTTVNENNGDKSIWFAGKLLDTAKLLSSTKCYVETHKGELYFVANRPEIDNCACPFNNMPEWRVVDVCPDGWIKTSEFALTTKDACRSEYGAIYAAIDGNIVGDSVTHWEMLVRRDPRIASSEYMGHTDIRSITNIDDIIICTQATSRMHNQKDTLIYDERNNAMIGLDYTFDDCLHNICRAYPRAPTPMVSHEC